MSQLQGKVMLRALRDFLIIVCVIVVGLAAIAVFARFTNSDDSTTSDGASVASAPAISSDTSKVEKEVDHDSPACRADLKCWAETGDSDTAAGALFKVWLNNHATHTVKWPGFWSITTMFDSFSWDDKGKGTVQYVGNNVMLQNAYGAMTKFTYVCIFDPATKTLLSVQMVPGIDTDNDVVVQAMMSKNLLDAPVSMNN